MKGIEIIKFILNFEEPMSVLVFVFLKIVSTYLKFVFVVFDLFVAPVLT